MKTNRTDDVRLTKASQPSRGADDRVTELERFSQEPLMTGSTWPSCATASCSLALDVTLVVSSAGCSSHHTERRSRTFLMCS